jgi:hypothetical protein
MNYRITFEGATDLDLAANPYWNINGDNCSGGVWRDYAVGRSHSAGQLLLFSTTIPAVSKAGRRKSK